MQSVITCSELRKDYGRKHVLKGVNLEIPQGTLFALLGTNGAGKTTLIRTILGLIPKTDGEVNVLGKEPYHLGPQVRQRIGYVSEEQGLYGWMSVQGIINFCKGLYDQWDDHLIDYYLERFKLDRKTKVGTLSKGQTVKLALILALAPKPELLILDEPMTGLDPLAQHEFLQVIMRDVKSEGRTVFFSTHILSDVEAIAEQAAIIYDGKIRTCGSIPDICRSVSKIKFNGAIPQEIIENGVLLTKNTNETIYLISNYYPETAATSEEPLTHDNRVTLEEAFLFFCAGGKNE